MYMILILFRIEDTDQLVSRDTAESTNNVSEGANEDRQQTPERLSGCIVYMHYIIQPLQIEYGIRDALTN